MAFEIERKYLLLPLKVKYFLSMFSIPSYKTIHIKQSYLERNGTIGRIIQYGDKFYLTIKKGEGLIREEHEQEITHEMYKKILSSSNKVNTIEKTMYIIKIGGFLYEIYEFEKNLEGLVFLEVEFSNENEAGNFELDDQFKKVTVKEVTNDTSFYNKSIAISQKLPYL